MTPNPKLVRKSAELPPSKELEKKLASKDAEIEALKGMLRSFQKEKMRSKTRVTAGLHLSEKPQTRHNSDYRVRSLIRGKSKRYCCRNPSK